jgi:lysozyme
MVDLEEGDLPPVVDIEQTYGVNSAILKKELKEWLDVIENYYNVKPIIYTSVSFYSRYLGKEFNSYPLWAAHYYQYDVPRIDRNWDFWQHSEEGRVNGILSKVDFNVFNGDSLQFRSILMAK